MSGGLRVVIVSGSGGVLLDTLALRPWWERHDTSWVAVPAADTEVALAGLPVTWLPDPPGWPHLAAATWRAFRLLGRSRPDLLISAGRRLAVPFFLAARLRGVPAVWLETLTQTGTPSGTARLAARLARVVLVQRPERVAAHRDAVLVGELY
jgi:UDP-N-acetylglucosamine:LPS N-acetylglucosamine transferase